MKTVIELLGWGDFDMQYTECIMVSPESFSVEELKKEYCELQGIASFKGVPHWDLIPHLKLFEEFLSERGFQRLKTKTVSFSD